MMKGCHFCEESSDFYKNLIQKYQSNGRANITAVFPTGTLDSENYLKQRGIVGVEIKSVDFVNIGVNGTPTIIITDDKGKLLKSWDGKLSPDREKEVIDFINS